MKNNANTVQSWHCGLHISHYFAVSSYWLIAKSYCVYKALF